MKNLVFILCTGLIITSCLTPAEKQGITESADIDLGKKVMAAYLAGDWDSYPGLYADTAKIWSNKNWTKDEGFTVQQYVDDRKSGLESVSSYKVEAEYWQSLLDDEGDVWVSFWGVWVGHSDATNKDYEIPLHIVMQVVDNKIIQQIEFYNETEITVDMMALAQEKEAVENEKAENDQ